MKSDCVKKVLCVGVRSGEVAPTTYISYQTADRTSPTYSDIMANTVNPVWDHTAEVPLSNELLTQDSKVRIFPWAELFTSVSCGAQVGEMTLLRQGMGWL